MPLRILRFSIDLNHYYLVEIEEINGKLEHYCNRLDEINLNGFTINEAETFKKANASPGPLLGWIELEEGTPIKVAGIEKRGNTNYNTFDHWYEIIIEEKIHWIFGFYLNFKKRIKIL
jgi:hypothetical protein